MCFALGQTRAGAILRDERLNDMCNSVFVYSRGHRIYIA